jgi:hypothetical protein
MIAEIIATGAKTKAIKTPCFSALPLDEIPDALLDAKPDRAQLRFVNSSR